MKHNCRTTHYACDCFLGRMALLEKVATAAEKMRAAWIHHICAKELLEPLEVLRKAEPKKDPVQRAFEDDGIISGDRT